MQLYLILTHCIFYYISFKQKTYQELKTIKNTSGRLIDEAIIQGKFPARGMEQVQERAIPYLLYLANQLVKLDFDMMSLKGIKNFYTEYINASVGALYTHSAQGRLNAIRFMKVLSNYIQVI